MYYDFSSKVNEVPSATNQLANHQEVEQLTTNFQMPDNERPANSFIINDDYEDEYPPIGYAAVDTKSVRKINNITFII